MSTELTEELNSKLYQLSIGNLDMAHRIYRNAQRLVIGSGDERITSAVLEQAYISACGLSAKTEEVRTLRKEITLPRRSKSPRISPEVSSPTNSRKTIVDISRPQPPEFEYQLRDLINAVDLNARIEKPDQLRRASDDDSPINQLKNNGILCDDPLECYN